MHPRNRLSSTSIIIPLEGTLSLLLPLTPSTLCIGSCFPLRLRAALIAHDEVRLSRFLTPVHLLQDAITLFLISTSFPVSYNHTSS